MRIAQHQFSKGGQTLSVILQLGRPGVFVGGSADDPALELTPFEKSRLDGWDHSGTPDEAIALYEEIFRRRIQDGWVASDDPQDRRAFRRVAGGGTEHWSIGLSQIGRNSVELSFGPLDETYWDWAHPAFDPRRRQIREFRISALLRRWYAHAVASRLAEGYVEIAPGVGAYASLGNDPAILAEEVDPGELISDNRADPDSPEARFMERHRRPCWVPVTAEGDGPDRGSKFSGLPWLADEADWPSCRQCGRPMLLFLQLDLASLPYEFDREPSGDLLQFFACREHASDFDLGDGDYCTYTETNHRRLVRPDGKNRAKVPEGLEPYPARRIVGWDRHDDYPALEDHHRIERAEREGKADDYLCEVVDSGGLHDQFPTRQGDKLGGWSYYIGSQDVAMCPRCGRPMELLFQLDSAGNLPEDWGDKGIAHLTRCPEHKDVLHFDTNCG